MTLWVEITDNYRGRLTNEQLVRPGIYALNDPALHGLTADNLDYLVRVQRKARIHDLPEGVHPGTLPAVALTNIKQAMNSAAAPSAELWDQFMAFMASKGVTLPGQKPAPTGVVQGEAGESAKEEYVKDVVPPADGLPDDLPPEPPHESPDQFSSMKAAELKEYITAHGGEIPAKGSGAGGLVKLVDLQAAARALPVQSDEAE